MYYLTLSYLYHEFRFSFPQKVKPLSDQSDPRTPTSLIFKKNYIVNVQGVHKEL